MGVVVLPGGNGGLGDEGAQSLCDALRAGLSLRSISLSACRVSAAAASQLCSLARGSLVELTLGLILVWRLVGGWGLLGVLDGLLVYWFIDCLVVIYYL